MKKKRMVLIQSGKKIRVSVIMITAILSALILVISYSYAFYTVSTEKKNALSLISGNLSYRLMENTQEITKVTLAAGETREIHLVVESLNNIESVYQLYTVSNSNQMKVTYVDQTGFPNGEIGATGSKKKITLIVENNSSMSDTIEIGAQGGLKEKQLVLKENRIGIKNIFTYQKNYDYRGNYETFTAPATGYYDIELWGASGSPWIDTSNGVNIPGGLGGYTKGSIFLQAEETLYVYVGEGNITDIKRTTGSFNGGGYSSNGDHVEIGGGATDIRLVSGSWDEPISLRSRIMVAGGGGGHRGGDGGGLIAHKGFYNSAGPTVSYVGFGGGQTQGGAQQTNGGEAGTFGIGGKGVQYIDSHPGGGGSGGYYGGSGAKWDAGGGGGSSFISGYGGCNAIDQQGNHTNQTIHYSGKHFINSEMQVGVNEGNGKARITFVSKEQPQKINYKLNQVRYIKDCIGNRTGDCPTCRNWGEIQAIKDGENLALHKNTTSTVTNWWTQDGYTYNASYALNGIIETKGKEWAAAVSNITSNTDQKCITVDLGSTYDLDEIYTHHLTNANTMTTNGAFQDNELYVSSDNQNWTPIIQDDVAYYEGGIGRHISAWNNDYPYPDNVYLMVNGANYITGGFEKIWQGIGTPSISFDKHVMRITSYHATIDAPVQYRTINAFDYSQFPILEVRMSQDKQCRTGSFKIGNYEYSTTDIRGKGTQRIYVNLKEVTTTTSGKLIFSIDVNPGYTEGIRVYQIRLLPREYN